MMTVQCMGKGWLTRLGISTLMRRDVEAFSPEMVQLMAAMAAVE